MHIIIKEQSIIDYLKKFLKFNRFLSIPLSELLGDEPETQLLRNYILFGPPISTIFWLTLSLFGFERRNYFLFLLSYLCVFFILPMAIYPLASIDFFEYNNIALIVAYSLIGLIN